ncbi:hypothetical protein Q428_04285 [Fervidicella metallireducens AeB]|uniref:DNA 3'-5' helicase n=1 Tax=Fervidicella metallireducens AeB TaxID=1403537 RepID=A0A017RXP9_9CLOT|nr:hypothetical protein Q428_04285 [Fervidicella metallireducens AeB]
MIDLKDLNKEQREAVESTEGPLLILAGAGSGKTRVLTYRIANLIEKGVFPGNILAITFTNKAAAEMKERIQGLVGEEARNMWVSTFHSTCVRILRQDIDKIGYNKNFVIYDTNDQEKLIKECLKELNLDEKLYVPKDIINKIGSQKDVLIDADTFYRKNANDFKTRKIAEIYKLYQKKLKDNNALDFDDIIMKTVLLFKEHDDVLKYYQRKFRYIMVDEYQDTNKAQYELIKLMSSEHKNLCVVGDDDQCILKGMKITTPNGDSNIEEIKEKDNVVCAAGYGEAGIGVVDKVMKKKYVGPVIKVTTKTGREIKATPNHIGFAKINANPGVYYVYLMYKRGVGFRIGQTQDVRSRKGEIVSGLYVRLNQEHADKMWILKVCNNKAEASYYEQFFAFRYGIPTTVFETTGRKMSMTQEYINKIFNEINTQEAASRLMEDNMIFEEYPHHICNAVIKGQSTRRIVNICSFGGKRYQGTNCCSHRIALITSGDELKKSAQENDFPVRDGQRDTWRIETERKDYDEAVLYAKKIAQIDNDLEIVKKARLTEEKSFDYMHLHI